VGGLVRARRLDRWGGSAEPADVPEPVPAEGEVLVRVEACGIGLTVLNCMNGDLGSSPDDLPRVPGHELVGRIVDAGPGVPRARVGERVSAFFYLFCGRCPACLAGEESLCERLAGFVGVHRDGGYAELASLPERNAVTLPPGIDPVLATAVPDAIATPVHVARRAGIGPGRRVAVLGAAGGVGIHMLQVAAVSGAEVLGLEATPAKVAHLRDELGVAAADSSDLDAVELPAGWERGPDVVVDLVGRPETLGWAVDHLATGGRLVALTTFREVELAVSPRELVFRQLSLLGSRYASRHELVHAAELVALGRVRPVVTERAGIDDVDRIHEALRAGELVGRGALVWD
jgi:D-arabinose 1-dehydrogenase-like Zn-dependent alcohol dehydrogenase